MSKPLPTLIVRLNLLFAVFLLFTFDTSATHIAGGIFSYHFIGSTSTSVSYNVKLELWNDCKASEVALDQNIDVGVYNASRELIKVVNVELNEQINESDLSGCSPEPICIKKGSYNFSLELPLSDSGYHVAFVRCCRGDFKNILNQSGTPHQGNTFYAFIGPSKHKKSSVQILNRGYYYLYDKEVNVIPLISSDQLAGSSVELVAPFAGGSPTQGGAKPNPADNLDDPIASVSYSAGYFNSRPLGVGTTVEIEKENLIIRDAVEGVYALALDYKFFENSNLTALSRMDITINVAKCESSRTAFSNDLQAQELPDQKALLSWTYCSDSIKKTIVQKKNQGSGEFEDISELGDSVSTIEVNLSPGWNVFQIKQKDHLDSTGVSNEVSLEVDAVSTAAFLVRKGFHIYPNPAKGIVKISVG